MIFYGILVLLRGTQAMVLLRGALLLIALIGLLTSLQVLPAFSWLVQKVLILKIRVCGWLKWMKTDSNSGNKATTVS